MSADRWSVCPRCTSRLEAEICARQEALDAAYGTVALDEFGQMRAVVEALRNTLATEGHDRYTFREDYEFYGASEGFVTADYSGSCSTCGLKVRLEHTVHFEDTA